MIFRHRYLKAKLCQNKVIKKITEQDPLIVVAEELNFLTYTIQVCLRHGGIPFQFKAVPRSELEAGNKIIDHEVPIFVFSERILQKYQIADFLCDYAFQQEEDFADFINRKNWVKQTVVVWSKLFQFERNHIKDFKVLKDIGVYSEKDYKNVVLQQLQNLNIKFNGKLLSKSFKKYSDQTPCLQNILLVDIVNSIIHWIPNSYLDFYLRSHFTELLNLKQEFQTRISLSPQNISHQEFQIVLDEPRKPDLVLWKTFNVNTVRFLVTFSITGIIYATFVQT